uniref:Uncharacterized protein n=1 Tax=Kalanchoe fedtschenkoi TaxID=63787 RepID=A0A7N1A261_KALFE
MRISPKCQLYILHSNHFSDCTSLLLSTSTVLCMPYSIEIAFLLITEHWKFMFYKPMKQVIKVDHEAHGVDTSEDVEKIERYMREKNIS